MKLRRILPMMALALLLCGCGGAKEDESAAYLAPYQNMESCSATAELICLYPQEERRYTLRCDYVPAGESSVTVLLPEELKDLRAVFDGADASLRYDDLCLDAPVLGEGKLSPAAALPQLFTAMREGWLLESSRETCEGQACVRLCFESALEAEKRYTDVYLEEETGVPVLAEVSEGEMLIFRLAFTDFAFGAILEPSISNR